MKAAPLFARGASSTYDVRTEMRQREQTACIDLTVLADDADCEETESKREASAAKHSYESTTTVNSSTSRRSPNVSRKSPSLRGITRGREPPPTKILDFMFLGNVYDANNVDFLTRNNIRTIINVSTEEYFSPLPGKVAVHWFSVEDRSDFDITGTIEKAEAVILSVRARYYSTTDEEKRERILIHCQKGRSRSATVVLAHLVLSNGWAVAEALAYVAEKREQVEPNLGFLDALIALQDGMGESRRAKLRRRLCLRIRNLVSSAVELPFTLAKVSELPSAPLELLPRKNKDGSPREILTLGSIKGFFETNVGMVSNATVHVKRVMVGGGLAEVGEEWPLDEGKDSQLPPEHERHTSTSGSPIDSASEGLVATESGAPDDLRHATSTVGQGSPRSSSTVVLVFFPCWEEVRDALALFKNRKELLCQLTDTPETLDVSLLTVPSTKGKKRKA